MNLQQLAADISNAYTPPANGRPSDISDPIIVQELLEAMEAGNYMETACELAGVAKVTVYNWLKRAEAGEEPFTAFSYAMKRASARAEALAVQRVRQAGKDPRFWAAEMTFLERRHPDKWARRSEDGNSPRVVVQIGCKDSDVQVCISSPQPTVPLLSE